MYLKEKRDISILTYVVFSFILCLFLPTVTPHQHA
jgi:hypothetical protein